MGQSLGLSRAPVVYAPREERYTEFPHSPAYRMVLFTSATCQVVTMRIEPGTVIPGEIHNDADQVFTIVDGAGHADLRLPGKELCRVALAPRDVLVVQKGCWHLIAAHSDGLRLVSTYAPPVHPPGTVHWTAAEGEAK